MGWIKFTGSVFEYCGKIMKAEGFEEWAKSEGSTMIENVISREGFKFFAKNKARNLIKSNFINSGNCDTLDAVLKDISEDFFKSPGILGINQKKLPKVNSFSKVVVLPRFLLIIYTYKEIKSALHGSAMFNRITYGDYFKEYVYSKLLSELDSAIFTHKISVRKPIVTSNNFSIIGKDETYPWNDLYPGHYYLYNTKFSYDEDSAENDLHETKVFLGKISEREIENIVNHLKV